MQADIDYLKLMLSINARIHPLGETDTIQSGLESAYFIQPLLQGITLDREMVDVTRGVCSRKVNTGSVSDAGRL